MNYIIVLLFIFLAGFGFYLGFLQKQLYDDYIFDTTKRISFKILNRNLSKQKDNLEKFLKIRKCKQIYTFQLILFYCALSLIVCLIFIHVK